MASSCKRNVTGTGGRCPWRGPQHSNLYEACHAHGATPRATVHTHQFVLLLLVVKGSGERIEIFHRQESWAPRCSEQQLLSCVHVVGRADAGR